MKLITNLLLALIMTLVVFSNAHAYELIDGQNPSAKFELFQKYGVSNEDEFLALTPSKIKKQTGDRLNLKETILLKAAQKKLKKDLKSKNQNSAKSQIIALVLVLLVGYLGVHRFYLGYTGIAIIQLLTAGMCGIWTLIDLFRIIAGDLKPKDGSDYDPTL